MSGFQFVARAVVDEEDMGGIVLDREDNAISIPSLAVEQDAQLAGEFSALVGQRTASGRLAQCADLPQQSSVPAFRVLG